MYTYDAVAWDRLFLLMGIIGASELVTFLILKGLRALGFGTVLA